MAFFQLALFLSLAAVACGQASSSSLAAPLSPWAIACVSLSSVGCAVGLALILIGVALRLKHNKSRWELIVSGCILFGLCSVTLITSLVLSFSSPVAAGDVYSGTQVVVINVYAQPTQAPGLAPQLMADVRLSGGVVRSVFVSPVSGPVAAGQAGYIDFQGQLRVYPHGYSPYVYYGYGYGGFLAMFFIVLFFSSFMLCFCVFPEPQVVKYVEVERASPPEKRKEDNLYEPPIPHLKEEAVISK